MSRFILSLFLVAFSFSGVGTNIISLSPEERQKKIETCKQFCAKMNEFQKLYPTVSDKARGELSQYFHATGELPVEQYTEYLYSLADAKQIEIEALEKKLNAFHKESSEIYTWHESKRFKFFDEREDARKTLVDLLKSQKNYIILVSKKVA